MTEITIFIAFAAGMLSFLSPCVFPLIPAYVTQMTGAMAKGGKIEVSKRRLLLRSVSFIAGFSIVFIVMGASASFVGQFFVQWRSLAEKLGGLLIIVFGLQMTGWLSLKFLMKQVHWKRSELSRNRSLDSFVMGLAFGTGWTPCVGLALSSILMLAGSADTMLSGMGLLFVYSIGLGIPFILIALLVTYSLGYVKRVNRILPALSKVNGWVLIAMGLLLYTGQLQKISGWLSSYTLWNI
ncbi:cytochrome c biogenesis CcdA family protein [Paenibacillus bouchesdurhonensis]|uniref:cytochrome c biogenesis CcdA family protein n=1 Tax=Paenibacillus bouchesdurhonensis TaxID=1870990 RepID=UPI0018FFB67A|nr:cytochrome c biogenesis CcdA family protein [Paenibacillus bouchesdurhonensis]